jgi:hypothetical protein
MYPKLLVTASLLLSLSISVFSQGADAVLTGTVTDPNGAVVPNAKVVAQNIATSVALNAVSNEAGIYLSLIVSYALQSITDHRRHVRRGRRQGH